MKDRENYCFELIINNPAVAPSYVTFLSVFEWGNSSSYIKNFVLGGIKKLARGLLYLPNVCLFVCIYVLTYVYMYVYVWSC